MLIAVCEVSGDGEMRLLNVRFLEGGSRLIGDARVAEEVADAEVGLGVASLGEAVTGSSRGEGDMRDVRDVAVDMALTG